MNEKIKLRDNRKLLVRYSLIQNIIILIAKITIAVSMIVSKNRIIESAHKAAESGEGSIWLGAVISLLLVFIYIGIIAFIGKAIFSIVTIAIGIKNKFNKAYSTLSVVTTFFVCFHAFGAISFLISEFTHPDIHYDAKAIITYVVGTILFVGFAVFNTIIQMMLSKLNTKCELEELLKSSTI